MISNATANAIGSKVTPGGGRSNPELITNGDFQDGDTGWLVVAPTVTIRRGQATIGPAARPPYAAIGQRILEDGASYNVTIEVVSIPEGQTADVRDGSNTSVYSITSAGQKSFSFTNSTWLLFSITSLRELLISNVSVKKS